MPKIVNLRDQRFGRLVVVAESGRDMQGRKIWLCSCDCGKAKSIRSRNLISGLVRSCGCLGAEACRLNGKRGAKKISGAKSHLYRHGLSADQRLKDRNLVETRVWRAKVFAAFDYTCDLCGERGKKIAAHHLDCWAGYPDRRFDPTNGVCLCAAHHQEFHMSMGGQRHHCSEEDYRAFKARWYVEREIGRLCKGSAS